MYAAIGAANRAGSKPYGPRSITPQGGIELTKRDAVLMIASAVIPPCTQMIGNFSIDDEFIDAIADLIVRIESRVGPTLDQMGFKDSPEPD